MAEVRQLRRMRPANDLSVGQLTLTELHHELQRRINELQEQKRELHERIEKIDRELAALGPIGAPGAEGEPAPKRGGARSINEAPLKVVLTRVLQGRSLTTRECADAVLETGYISHSRNFANTVGVSLHREPRFVKTDGKWSLVEGEFEDEQDANPTESESES